MNTEYTILLDHRSARNRLMTCILAIFLRVLAYIYCIDFLKKRPELNVPQNSFRRLVDGVHMVRDGVSPYDGDMIHCVCLQKFLFFDSTCKTTTDPVASIQRINRPSKLADDTLLAVDAVLNVSVNSGDLLKLFFQSLDVVTSEILRMAATIYLKSQKSSAENIERIADLVSKCYMLNPIAVAACAVFSLSVVCNFITALFILAFVKDFRWGLISGGALSATIVLAPIMWQMWIVTGSGNANFYFAATLTYSVAQIFLLTDLLYGYLRLKLMEGRGITDESKVAALVLK
uniref:Uncharacterized protein n=1 Tax=Setaria digitata TaxID=48799 RepID=A0A915Q5L7_9BILA